MMRVPLIRKLAVALAGAMLVAGVATPASAQCTPPKVVTMTIIAAASTSNSSINITGHAFLMFKNISSSAVKVGVVTLGSKDVISVGTWGNRRDGKGIYYNLERYYGASGFPGRVSYSVNLTAAELTKVNNYIKGNNHWSEVNNCAMFAKMTWYQVARPAPSAGTPVTVAGLVKGIKAISGYKTNIAIPSATKGMVYRQDGSSGYHVAKI